MLNQSNNPNVSRVRQSQHPRSQAYLSRDVSLAMLPVQSTYMYLNYVSFHNQAISS